MLVKESPKYDVEFPEDFGLWASIDNVGLDVVCTEIVEEIRADLKTIDRNLAPGLRSALNKIANIARI